jgi:putative nucleotidyltransferase with HDIG domain
LQPYQEWLDFFNTLAGQTAIAIESTSLFANLQASNDELTQAYEATIEGWSRAMDLRDRETKGHTQRVTKLTLQLARSMGIDDSQLTHIRRGALLHDIGKLGVPDNILFKAGSLTAEERQIMEQHVDFAYEMLAPIPYLKPALNIPYFHHEKWDGTGYPLGLKGQQIPLEARIFALVDVWDALLSDRPYRKAWSRERTLDYIRAQNGIHFDPQVVECFLEVIE